MRIDLMIAYIEKQERKRAMITFYFSVAVGKVRSE